MMIGKKDLFFVVMISLLLVIIIPCYGQPRFGSPNGKYEAIRFGSGRDIHYKVMEIKTGDEVLVTNAQYDTPNDVKAASFSPDSKKFAAAYHYSHKGRYTWIGIWDMKTGMLRQKEKPGWTTDICSVFKE